MPESLKDTLTRAVIESAHQAHYGLTAALAGALAELRRIEVETPPPALDETTRLVPMIGATRNEQPTRFPTHCGVLVRRAGQLIYCGAVIVRVDSQSWAHMGGESDHKAHPIEPPAADREQ